jgi:cytochrome c biogenesis protein CcmG/thiol:disulfide interchange protein DsbE
MPSMLIDRPVPDFALPPIEGREMGLSTTDLAGEVRLLNVFGSWCAACLIEHPLLMEIAAEGQEIVAINWKDRPGAGARWLQRHGDPYSRVGDDADGRAAIEFGVTGAPETFVVDANGRVRHKQIGPITPEIWRGVLKPMIEELRNAPAADPAGPDADSAGSGD